MSERGEHNPWMAEALCAEVDAELMFPEKGDHARDGLKICDGCNVVQQCLKYALDNRIRHGIWGAKTPEQRSRIRNRVTV